MDRGGGRILFPFFCHEIDFSGFTLKQNQKEECTSVCEGDGDLKVFLHMCEREARCV